ncbi:hypothetical protein XELAEV_18026232mg [Xenopus laevis]|uniref:Uncharacterized protein n=1 Tax=Xenopus laevis TaxID=8355 RepID=A0A974CTH2_XENLA|nr:hypothetical protein XELAEV_18026232mg [Xenopus laevis]
MSRARFSHIGIWPICFQTESCFRPIFGAPLWPDHTFQHNLWWLCSIWTFHHCPAEILCWTEIFASLRQVTQTDFSSKHYFFF